MFIHMHIMHACVYLSIYLYIYICIHMYACIPCPSIRHKGAHGFLGFLFCSRHIINMCLLLKIRLGIIQLGKLNYSILVFLWQMMCWN